MKTQPRQHISNKYNTCAVVTSPVYIGSKVHDSYWILLFSMGEEDHLIAVIKNVFLNA